MPEAIKQGDVQVDFIYQGKAHGAVASRVLSPGFNVNRWRPWIGDDGLPRVAVPDPTAENGLRVTFATNATLRKDEWKQYDTAVIGAAQLRMNGVADLISRGLVYNIPNGLGTTVLEYEKMSDMEAAEISMDAVTRGQNDRVEFDISYLPLPIVHKDFQINARVLESSRTTGRPLDTTQAEIAAQKVAEKIETILFQGSSSYTFGGGTIFGYQDATNRNTVGITANWDASGTTGANILTDVKAMKQAAINDRHYGPYVLYVPTAYETVLDADYATGYPKTIRSRIMEIANIAAVKVSDYLSANNVILVQMTSDVVRLVQGMPISTIEWRTDGGMVYHYKVMTIMVPQLRDDFNSRSGIIHLS